MSILSHIFNTTQNVGICPTENFRILQIFSGQKFHFEPNFEHDSKFLAFVKFHPLQVWSGQNSQFWGKFSAQLLISGFCQISSFACLKWSKNVKIETKIFNSTQNVVILSNFILRMFWAVKNVGFWAKFSTQQKISRFCRFSVVRYLILIPFDKNVNFEPNFQHNSKRRNFVKFHPSYVLSCQKCRILSQIWKFGTQLKTEPNLKIWNTTENFRILQVLSGQISHLEPKYEHDSKFLDLAKFHFSQVLNFYPNFYHDWKFLNFAEFYPLHVLSDQKCRFWAKFSTQVKISGFCQISSFAGLKRSKMSILSHIFNTTQNVGILSNFILRMFWAVKNVGFWAKFENLEHNWKLSQIWKFESRLKISGFCRFSVVRYLIWSQNMNTAQNFWIYPNFIFHRSRVVKLSIFIQIFTTTENFWILQNFILCMFLSDQKYQKCRFWAKFSTQLKISGFCQISSFAGR